MLPRAPIMIGITIKNIIITPCAVIPILPQMKSKAVTSTEGKGGNHAGCSRNVYCTGIDHGSVSSSRTIINDNEVTNYATDLIPRENYIAGKVV